MQENNNTEVLILKDHIKTLQELNSYLKEENHRLSSLCESYQEAVEKLLEGKGYARTN